jgi:hypothetical protein
MNVMVPISVAASVAMPMNVPRFAAGDQELAQSRDKPLAVQAGRQRGGQIQDDDCPNPDR